MAKLLIRFAGLVLGGIVFAGTAAAQVITDIPYDAKLLVDPMQERMYAAELFGEGSDDVVLDYGDGGSLDVYLILTDHTGTAQGETDGSVAENSVGTITYRLSGAVFDQAVRGSALSLVTNVAYTAGVTASEDGTTAQVSAGHTAPAEPVTVALLTRNREGGGRGDNYVTFDIENEAEITAHATLATDNTDTKAIRLQLPPLTETSSAMGPGGRGVRVAVELDGSTSAADNWPSFPSRAQQASGKHRIRVIPPAYSLVNGQTTPNAALAVGVTASEAHGGRGSVTIMADDRTQLRPSSLPVPRDPQYLKITDLSISKMPNVRQSDGEAFSVKSRTGEGGGDFDITVVGNLRDDDMIVWDLNKNGMADSGEMLDVSPGIATGSFSLDSLFVDEDGEEGDDGQAAALLYFPNGKDPMRDGTLIALMHTNFNEPTNDALGRRGLAVSVLTYDAGSPIKAYALAPMSTGDETNVRIRCGSSLPCEVYVSCDAADGTNFFGKMAGEIAPWSVTTVNSMGIADVVGADDADFAGRMSCDVIGANQVQVLTRSGGVLVNNTTVNE